MSTRLLLALPLILPLAACSSTERRLAALDGYAADPRYSFANNVMRASGRTGIRDGDGLTDGGFSGRQDGGSLSTIGAGALTGNLGLGLGLGLTRGLTGPGYNQGTSNMVIAWMPAEMARDGFEARDKLNEFLWSVLPSLLLEHGLNVREAEAWSSPQYNIENIRGIHIDYPNCAAFCDERYYFSAVHPLHATVSPSFTGSYNSFSTTGGRDVGTPSWGRLTRGDGTIDELALYRSLSQRLPEWTFIYLAPNQWASCQTDGCRARDYPLLLHQGEIHHFVTPGTGFALAD